ncbi:MAG: hypothetical protein WC222_02730 [Parachlamydiales bacterium]|jgi:hypothetical protein
MPMDGILGGVKIPFFNRGSSSTEKKEGKLKTPNKAEPRIIAKPTPKTATGAERVGVISIAPKEVSKEKAEERKIIFKETLSKKLKLGKDKGKLNIYTYEGSALDSRDNKAIKDGYYAKNVRYIVQVEIPSTTPDEAPHTSELELDFSFKIKSDSRDNANIALRKESQVTQAVIAKVAKKELKKASIPVDLTPLKDKFVQKVVFIPTEKTSKVDKEFENKRKSKISPQRMASIQLETSRALRHESIHEELQILNQFSSYLNTIEAQKAKYNEAQANIKIAKRKGDTPTPKDLAVKPAHKQNKELKLVNGMLTIVDKSKVNSKDRLAVAFHLGALAMSASNQNITDLPKLNQQSSDSKNEKEATVGLTAIMENVLPKYSQEALANPELGKILITSLNLQYIEPKVIAAYQSKVDDAQTHKDIFAAFAKASPSIGKPNDMGKTFDPDTMYHNDLIESRTKLDALTSYSNSLPDLPKKPTHELTSDEKRIIQLNTSAQQTVRNKIRNQLLDLQDPLKLTVNGALTLLENNGKINTPEYKNLQQMSKELKNGISTIDLNELAKILHKNENILPK